MADLRAVGVLEVMTHHLHTDNTFQLIGTCRAHSTRPELIDDVVRTSPIQRMEKDEDHWVAVTRNTRYTLTIDDEALGKLQQQFPQLFA